MLTLSAPPPSLSQVQGHESEKFQQLFNYKIKYLRGGTESALNHVTEEAYENRLLHLLGKKGVVRQVDATCGSLNDGDVFVLDAGKNIFVWVGKEAGLVKQSKGLEIANMINSENKGQPDLTPPGRVLFPLLC
jgi:hypothetical protein